MSLDIIHPRSQCEPETGFIEPWADRKLRRERERAGRRIDLPRRAKSAARQYDPDFERRFRRLYAGSMKYPQIAAELGIPQRAVGQLRTFYGLPRRTDRDLNPSAARVGISFDISAEIDHAVTLHCRGRYRTRSDFFREAVRRMIEGRT